MTSTLKLLPVVSRRVKYRRRSLISAAAHDFFVNGSMPAELYSHIDRYTVDASRAAAPRSAPPRGNAIADYFRAKRPPGPIVFIPGDLFKADFQLTLERNAAATALVISIMLINRASATDASTRMSVRSGNEQPTTPRVAPATRFALAFRRYDGLTGRLSVRYKL